MLTRQRGALKESVIDVVAGVSMEDRGAGHGRKVTVNGVEGAWRPKARLERRRRAELAHPRAVDHLGSEYRFHPADDRFVRDHPGVWHPGTFVPGVIGGISLLLALIGLSTLPVHYGALACFSSASH